MGRGIAALSVLASFAIPVQMSASAAGQDATPPPTATPAVQPLDQRFMESLTRGHYLEAMDMVEQADPSEVNDLVQSTYGQFRPVLDGFVVNGAAPDPSVTPDDAELAAYDGAEAQDAIAAIVSQARQTRIVIVNETHDNPRDRAFILKVAEALRPLGFTHYAAETFTNFSPDAAEEMGWLESEGYPRWTSGTFTVDPMFAYLVRRCWRSAIIQLLMRRRSRQSSSRHQQKIASPCASRRRPRTLRAPWLTRAPTRSS